MRDKKAALRREIRQKMAAFSPEFVTDSDKKIFENFALLPELAHAKNIFAYLSVGREADTVAILKLLLKQGKTVALPRTYDGGIMEARIITSLEELVPGKFNIPTAPDSAEILPIEAVDTMLVPAVTFDYAGYRLGQGGGYYDRYLEKANCLSIGLGREELLQDAVPREWHDVCVDILVTDEKVRRYEK